MQLELPPAPRILIVRLSAIGDVIFAMPVATALKKRFAEAHITWLVESTSADLVRHHPHVDHVVVLPRKGIRNTLRRPWGIPGAMLEVLRRMRDCRQEGFHMVLDLQGNMKSGILTGLSGGRWRVGHDRQFRKELLNGLFSNIKVHPVPEGAATRHRTERDLGMLRAVGIPAEHEPCALELPGEIHARARDFVSSLPGAGPLVVLHPGTSAFGALKRWPVDRFAVLADRLARESGARIAISWGPGEEDLARTTARKARVDTTLFPPPTNLLFPAAVYARADLVVGADSGPLHLATLMGTPTLTLFGPKDPEVYHPLGESARFVWMQVHCSPCTLRTCDHVTCMQTMTVEQVFNEALKLLETGPTHRDTSI
jgi:lipopolysaccharide heptosyltransferase I